MSIVDVGLADVLYEWNDLEPAFDRIQKGCQFVSVWSKVDDIALAHAVHSKILSALGRITEAQETIDKGLQVILSNGSFAEARDEVKAVEIRLHLREDGRLEAIRLTGSLETRLGQDYQLRFDNELPLIALARVYITRGKLEEAVDILSRLEAEAQSAQRTGRLIQILVLQARAMQDLGEMDLAFSNLERALALAEPEGYMRIFIDEGQPIWKLLTQWMTCSKDSSLQEYARCLISHFQTVHDAEPEKRPQVLPTGQLIEPLSPREIEVLQQIALGKTNKEIAQILVVSPGTIKAHTSSIYRKLEVSNRTESSARARQLEIIS